ncbi:sugar transferase [Frigoribacterium sp. UYMn621]|uniref:sugar transferase n=1 Tax=Frigoribacterium sp. UYMn621 TaxID=3156343 RepID=UPI00339203DF
MILVAVLGAFATRFWWDGDAADLPQFAAGYWMLAVVIVTAWVISLSAMHTRNSRVVGIGLAEYRNVVYASVLAFGLLAISLAILDIRVARGFFVLALPMGLLGLLVNRWLWRRWLVRQRSRGRFISRAIVVGKASDVEYVIGQIDKKAVSVYQVIGAAVDLEDGHSVTVNSRRVSVVSDLKSVAHVAGQLRVDAVIVAGHPGSDEHFIRDLGWDLEGTGAELVVASRLTNVAGPRIHFRPVEGLPLMHVELPHYEGGKHVLKRGLDVAASGVALLILSPLMVAISLLIRRDSEGPVFFRQERVGKDGRTFFMLKFRSMVKTAEDDLAGLLDQNEGAGVLFKMKNDPRITRIGRILRKYSLDELPQLWNILIGEMSLVGPRPPLMTEVENYGDRVHRRLYIKPGLTGMWQVNGRSNLDWDESVRLDLYYVENWSLIGDLVIIWRTFRVLVNPTGAY